MEEDLDYFTYVTLFSYAREFRYKSFIIKRSDVPGFIGRWVIKDIFSENIYSKKEKIFIPDLIYYSLEEHMNNTRFSLVEAKKIIDMRVNDNEIQEVDGIKKP